MILTTSKRAVLDGRAVNPSVDTIRESALKSLEQGDAPRRHADGVGRIAVAQPRLSRMSFKPPD